MSRLRGFYGSKKYGKRDAAFLDQQKLSNEQATAIREYFHKRLEAAASKGAILGLVVAASAIFLSDMLWQDDFARVRELACQSSYESAPRDR